MLISEKITIIFAIWIVILLFITNDLDLEIFFVLIFLGYIFIVIFTERFVTSKIKHRLNILLYVFIIIFIALIGKKIINFLGI